MMLRDYRELAEFMKAKFLSIEIWPEIEFNDRDKEILGLIDKVASVGNNSIQMKVDNNHIILPSQYILYAVCIKELAIALKNHLDFFDSFKREKAPNNVAESLKNETFSLTDITADSYSKSIGLKPLIDRSYNFEAKSIINGEPGSYKLRSTPDLFSSIILKIINVPDVSSAVVGKLIYSLTQNLETYSYLEKRFLSKLPYITKGENIGKFVKNVIYFLLQYDGMSKFWPLLKENGSPQNFNIEDGDLRLTSIFRKSPTILNEEDLSRGGAIRSFPEPIFLDSNHFFYLSNQWTNGTGSRLDLQTFIELFSKYYSEFKIIGENADYFLKVSSPLSLSVNNFQKFKSSAFSTALGNSGLSFTNDIINRFIGSLLTKPFIILTGLSGSGKTKLAQAFTQWITQDKSQYCIVSIGADWTNREPLLGFPNALEPEKYIMPDSGVLQLIIEASKYENVNKPYFLILDEMNLSHVERYFADFLSSMESRAPLKLHANMDIEGVPWEIVLPSNLFIIGTVNIDETTYMFSPKVLDRANVIEFRVTENEMQLYFNQDGAVDLSVLSGLGNGMAADFVAIANDKNVAVEEREKVNEQLLKFFIELKKLGAEFGYRSAAEMIRFIGIVKKLDVEWDTNQIIDAAIMQKLLPKVHGSRKKLAPVLERIGVLCLLNSEKNISDVFTAIEEPDYNTVAKYPISLEKINRMYRNLIDNGFTSYAEA